MQAVGGVGGVGGVTAAVAAAVLVLGLVGLVTAAGKPLSPTISDYDEVHLDVNDMQHRHRRARQHTQQGPMQVEFSAFGKDYVLDMRMSHDMFGDGFTIERHTDEGVKLARMDMHIFFRGEVAGEEGSDVRATVTDGVFKGTIRTGGDILYLEPAHRFSRDIATSHVAYWASSVNLTSPHDHDHSKVCGVDSHSHDSEIEAILDRMRRADHKYMKQYQRRQRRGFQGDPTKTTCQMALVSDHRFFATTGESDAGTTAQVMISWLEFVNRIYQHTDFGGTVGTGIQLVARRVIVYETQSTTDNPFASDTTSPYNFLDQLGTVKWTDYCLAHAFTNQDFAEGVVGLANVGTICRSPSNSGYTSSTSGLTVYSTNTGITTTVNFGRTNSELQTKLVFAHEVGHNFGMQHDDNCASYCGSNPNECSGDAIADGSGGRYIMWPQSVDGSESNNDEFSGCSIEYARARINTGSGAGGFCFTETQASFCGNGALEINEECDCGAACAEDPCCNENCELINGAQCSENSGPCCSNCQLVGIDMGVTPNPGDITSDIVCAEEQDCYTQRYCIKDPTLLGQCPEVHYPYHNDTDPPNCRGDASVSQCEVILDANNDYTFHKPLGTTCNEGSNICVLEGCAGSLCSQYQSTDVAGQMPSPGFNTSAYTPIQCALTGAKACHVACEFQQGVCNSTIDYATTPHGMNITKNGVPNSEVEPALRASGRSCNNFQGVCTPDGTCFESSAATPLDIFLSGSTLDWIISHWYITWAVLVGITLGAFIMRAYSRKQGGRIVIKEKDTDERKSLWQTLARRSKRGGHVKRDRQKNKVVVELQRQTDTAPNEALYRLKTLFPAAPDHVMQTVIKCSPHEEAAVFRLLHLGYAMRKLDDYKFLAFAGKKFRQDMRRHRLQQIQAQESTPHQQVQKPRRVVGFAPNNNQQGRALQARQGQRVVGVNTPKQQQQRQPQQQQQQRRARGKR